MVKQITSKADLESTLKSAGNKLVVIDFTATWCGPCRMIGPKLEAISQEMSDIVCVKVDVDQNEDIAAEYKISCMPTFVFIKNGTKVAEFSGADEDKLRSTIQSHK